MKAREAAVKDLEAKLKRRRGRLGAMEQELEARKVELDGKARVLAEDRVAFAGMEKRARAFAEDVLCQWPGEPAGRCRGRPRQATSLPGSCS